MAKKANGSKKEKVAAKKKENKEESSKIRVKDLAREISKEYSDLSIGAAHEIVGKIFNNISTHIMSGKMVSIHGFGQFRVKDRSERMGRNPQTGEQIKIEATKSVKFKSAKSLKQSVKSA